MRNIVVLVISALLAACGGGSGSSNTSPSIPPTTRAYSYSDAESNFGAAVTRNATVTVNGASTTIAFTLPAITLLTTDNWNSTSWIGAAGRFNQENAEGNFLRICRGISVEGTSVAVSEKMTPVAADTPAGRSVLSNRVFTFQDCTGLVKKTWTFNADGSRFASSDDPTVFYPSAVLDQLFSPAGFLDTSVTPNQTSRAKLYAMTFATGTSYFMVNWNTDGITKRITTAPGQ